MNMKRPLLLFVLLSGLLSQTDIFDFELTDDEMNRIASLNRNEKHDWY